LKKEGRGRGREPRSGGNGPRTTGKWYSRLISSFPQP